MSDKYIDNIVDDIYDIITKKGNWPFSFNVDDKLKLIKTMQLFYTKKDTRDGYTRCAILQKIVVPLEQQKTTDTSGSLDILNN